MSLSIPFEFKANACERSSDDKTFDETTITAHWVSHFAARERRKKARGGEDEQKMNGDSPKDIEDQIRNEACVVEVSC